MPEVRPQIYTVGHSTHPIEVFLSLLTGAGVEAVADVRRFPGSRRHPQFGADALADSLRSAGIAYEPFREQLGGRRSRKDAEAAGAALPDNSAWRNSSFRANADYMSTPAFAVGLERLEALGSDRPTASPQTRWSTGTASATRPSPRSTCSGLA